MRTEIITIGDEILIGQIIDTNSAFISKQLNKIGVQVYQITSVQDNREHILKALANARKRVQLVLVTGGLGPTKDDITKQAFLEYFNDTLVEDRAVREHIVSIFKKHLKREPLPSNLAQAMVPSKAMVLPNPYGTAPGMWLEKEGTVFVAMPGVPHEMENLLTNEVMPRVAKKFKRPYIYHTTLLTYGQGESEIQERAKHWENKLPPAIKLAYLPSIGRVRLRLSGNGTNKAALKTAVDRQMQQLQKILSDIAIGLEGETTIQQRIATALTAKNQTLSLAESCTGGAIASKITKVPGASAYFAGGITPYHTRLKTSVLKVSAQLINRHTAVSAPVAKAMAVQARGLFSTDYALAITGIAGPGPGGAKGALGTVYIALAGPSGVLVKKFSFGQPRERVIKKTVNKALEILLRQISKN